MKRSKRIFVGDFETTVFKGQTFTEVWASAVVELNTEDVHIFHSINDTFNFLSNLKEDIIIYYHNLKFDGAFWMDFLLSVLKYKQNIYVNKDDDTDVHWKSRKDLESKSFMYTISDMGQWYSFTIKTPYAIIEIRDSLKLLPFSVKQIGKSFDTKHKKLDMEYTGFRYAGCPITDEEKKYIANDVLPYSNNRLFLSSYIHSYISLLQLVDSSSTYLAWIDISSLKIDADKFIKVCKEHGLIISSGSIYGDSSFVRLNLAVPKSVLTKGLDRLKEAVESL